MCECRRKEAAGVTLLGTSVSQSHNGEVSMAGKYNTKANTYTNVNKKIQTQTKTRESNSNLIKEKSAVRMEGTQCNASVLQKLDT